MAGQIFAGNTLSLLLVVDGKTVARSVQKGHPTYNDVIKAINEGKTDKEILDALDISEKVKAQSDGKVTINGNVVMYDGEELHDNLTTKIVEYVRSGIPYGGLMKFLGRLMKNSSYNSRKHTYNFLRNKGVPITEDGCFLALKAVTADYKDKWTGKIDNSIGQTVKMDRGKIDDNPNTACAPGLHCGATEYVNTYGSKEAGDHIVVVKVSPENTVAVPVDHQMMKMRVCEYTVVADAEWDTALLDTLYSAENSEVVPLGAAPVEPVEEETDEELVAEADETPDYTDDDDEEDEDDWEEEDDDEYIDDDDDYPYDEDDDDYDDSDEYEDDEDEDEEWTDGEDDAAKLDKAVEPTPPVEEKPEPPTAEDVKPPRRPWFGNW